MNLKYSSRPDATTFFKPNSSPPRQRLCAEAMFRLMLVLWVLLCLIATPLPQSSADEPTASPLVTDIASLALSNQFAPANGIGLTGTGDVFFSQRHTAFFRWDSSSGTRTRVLQAGDPHPGFPGSVTDLVASPFHVNSLGHAATVNFFTQKGARLPRGVFVYDGTTFQAVAMRGDVAPGTGGQVFFSFGAVRINASDQVAFIGLFEPPNLGTLGLFIGSTTGPPVKIAALGDVAPGTGGGTYSSFQLFGFNDSGQVAFFSNIAGGSASRAVFIGSISGVSKVVAQGDPAPGTTGTFNLVTQNPFPYALNAAGDVAVSAQVIGGAPNNQGIWIGNSTSAPAKLLVTTDPTATTIGGFFGGQIFLHGFDDTGKALFRSNPVGATSSHALFQKDLSNPANVIFARSQPAPGGTTEVFQTTIQATVNDSGDVAFLASLLGGAFKFGWFLKDSAAPAVKITFQGESTPAGGTFGLEGANQLAEINNNRQVAFFGDILGPNDTGIFLYTPGSGLASVVNTGDSLPAGANPVIRTFMPAASDDLLLFYAFKAGGRIAAFTQTLQPCGSQITRIFGEGDTAPVIGGAVWGVLANFGLINDSEEVAFAATDVVGASVYPASIIFTHKPGVGLQKIAATGDPAPGAAGGTFSTFDTGTFFRPPARIDSSGRVAFFAAIAGSVSNSSPGGIFIGSVSGGVQRVARNADASP
ncbi:MAG: choice-of-anchor tandem repeat NxxGxxAF-containing protein, partial [Blastocatellia bacterium]